MNIILKLWHLIAIEQQKTLFTVMMLMLIGMLLETLSVGLVIPAIAIMTQTDFISQYPSLIPILDYLGNPSAEVIVIIGMISLIVIYAIKSLFLGFLAWRQMVFVHGVQAGLSFKLFSGYLGLPYLFHLQRNSAQLINNVINETNLFTHSVLIAGMTILTESLVMIGILVLLIIVEPVGAITVAFTLGVAGFTFNRMTKNALLKWGRARQKHEECRIQHLQQGLGGAKDVKLLGREDTFLMKYKMHNDGSARIGWKSKTLTQLPRLWLELLAVTGIAILVLTMIKQGRELESILPTMGLFAAAAFRIMPSVNRVLIAIQSLRFSMPVIERLHNETTLIKDITDTTASNGKLSFNELLELENISFKYLDSGKQILNNINIKIPYGSSVGFIGGSGAGKSTLVDILLGLLTPSQGTVKVDGIDIQKGLRNWQDHIGYVPQTIFLTDDTLRHNIAFGLSNDDIDEQALSHAIKSSQLEQFVEDLSLGLDTIVGERGVRLSGGQRQRIGIARALYHDPQVLVLDEATSSLDMETERGVMDSVRALQGDKTIIIVAHRLSTVEHCDILFRFENGRLVEQGNSSDMLGRP
jgi:ABC-type multidrug transport system fused ATPase/permease subunit